MNEDNFYSINRLVEFGMGMAVAQQMVKSMNHALTSTHIPGPMNPMPALAVQAYHIILEGKPAGPFSEQELSRLIGEGKVVKSTYVWKPGMVKWDVVENLADVLRLVALAPPPFKPEA
ncbi:MAG: DUF4339 domain-containing protein [Undibacterium sp.]|nr:DUF4339 domain-containing protein [Undibacterium sp.]